NIDLMTYCEVIDIKGEAGDYTVSILQKARRVDISTCIGCGTCSEKCPAKTPSEFDAYTSLRKAIYIPFPQAVPNKYLIDAEHCIYVQDNGKCGVCVKVCPVTDCIDLNAIDKVVEIKVGQIILATGFKVFDAQRLDQYGFGKLPNVVTSLELERLVNASGPTGGNITCRTKDKKGNWVFLPENNVPDRFAIIHCIGSRDDNYNKYCSKVCCMYSLKLAHLIKEKLPDALVDEYFIDMRAFGKGYDEFYERIKGENINMIRGRTAKIDASGTTLKLRSEDILNDRIIERNYDMVVLSVGLEASPDSAELSKLLAITRDENGWFQELDSLTDTENTRQSGIAIAGLCQGPKDIPDTVAQASAAASSILQNIHNKAIHKQPDTEMYEKIINDLLDNAKLKEVKI
nr:4Fe-4S dicluster domain-containing protein [Bacteroidales bacterium]